MALIRRQFYDAIKRGNQMLRVMTANLLNGKGRPEALGRLLDQYRPDILGVQELSANQAAVIEQHFGFGVAKPSANNDGKALMATIPINVDVLNLTYRSALRASVEYQGQTLDVISMHLANPVDGWRGRFPERRSQLDLLEPILRQPGPRILIGDMNSTPAWPAYRRLRRSLNDPIAEFARRHGRQAAKTWGYRPGAKARLRIDHILTLGFTARAVSVHEIAGSDHHALIADLELG